MGKTYFKSSVLTDQMNPGLTSEVILLSVLKTFVSIHTPFTNLTSRFKKGGPSLHHEYIYSATPFVLFSNTVWEAWQETEGLNFLL